MLTAMREATVVRSGAGKKMNVMGHTVSVKLTNAETNGDAYVFELVSPAGAGIPPHVHQNEDEIIYVAQGVYEVFLAGEIYQATAGAVIHFPRTIPHGFRNAGTEPGVTQWTVLPGASFERFFEELGSLPAGQPPDMDKVAEIFNRYDIEILPPAAA